MKKIILGLWVFAMTLPLWAQSEQTRLINNIKKESHLYLYGDVTLSTPEVAYEVALQELQASLAEWASNHSRKVVERTQITDLSLLADTIVVKRYNMYRVFAYVHKAKVMDVLNKNGFKIHDNLVTKDDPYNKNKLAGQHQPVEQRNIAQLPPQKKKEPKKEAPKKDVPKKGVREKSAPQNNGTEKAAPQVSPQPAPKTMPNTSDKAAPTPQQKARTMAVPMETLKEVCPTMTGGTASKKEEKKQKKGTAAPKNPSPFPKQKAAPLPDKHRKELEKILSARDFFDLEGIMMPMKKSGIITEMGRYASGTDISDCYLVVFDTDGNIRALLSPGTDSRTNIATGKPDSTSNYKNCGAIWFKMK